ncbi:MAG: AAA family ATPase [Bulleidia sp.]|nr:AAA family ATPase [Bulleidia sp.]
MGTYVNPGPAMFQEALRSEIYIDKSDLISYTNNVLGTKQKYVCVCRPRRFGKSMAADMLSAYYDRTAGTRKVFKDMKVGGTDTFDTYVNQFDVIKINMQEFLSRTSSIEELLLRLRKLVLRELLSLYPDVDYYDRNDFLESFNDIFNAGQHRFVVIIDEWDCIFREYPHDEEAQRKYLDFLRDWLKDKAYIALAYMTGILPIKKYGTHSALNMFTEYSMENPGALADAVGFSDLEVRQLCDRYGMDYSECQYWYNGYYFRTCGHVYNPNSIVRAMLSHTFDDYWNQTETYEALKIYIDMNYDGLRDGILRLMAGDHMQISTKSFQNDMTSFTCADDVLTLLVHLGYLGYDFNTKEAFVPNHEIMLEFVTATTAGKPWTEVINSVIRSAELLRATWNMDAVTVAKPVENAHFETSHLQYNDENALSYTISLAYYSARDYYTVIRELPSGKGFADLAFIPRQRYADKPAMLIELKWDQSAETAVKQIADKEYPKGLEEYKDHMLLVGINYDKTTKKHTCVINKA